MAATPDIEPVDDGVAPVPPAVAGCGVTLADGEAAEAEPPVEPEPVPSAAGALAGGPLLVAGDEPEPEPVEPDCEEGGGTVACCGATVALDELLLALLGAPL